MTMAAVYLDPLNQALTDVLSTQPPLEDLTIPQFRALVEEIQQHDFDPRVARTNFVVPFQDGVETFIFKPKGVRKTLPVIFYFHGAG